MSGANWEIKFIDGIDFPSMESRPKLVEQQRLSDNLENIGQDFHLYLELSVLLCLKNTKLTALMVVFFISSRGHFNSAIWEHLVVPIGIFIRHCICFGVYSLDWVN
jgi:hypothetical protein